MPDHRAVAVAGVDAQSPLPRVILQLKHASVLEDPLTTALHTQLASLFAGAAAELVVTVRAVEPLQCDGRHIADAPVGVQAMAKVARLAVVVARLQAQVHRLPKFSVEIGL